MCAARHRYVDPADDGGFGENGYPDIGLNAVSLTVTAVVVLVVLGAAWVWFFCRVSVGQGEFVLVLNKTGKDLTNEQILAPTAEYRGPQMEMLKEGRHFRNPYYLWWTDPIEATVIPKLKVGVLVRKYGKPLPPGEVIAKEESEKGILADPILPGRHYISTWAFEIESHDMVKIEPGYMGVVTLMVGDMPTDANVFVVKEGERGVQPYLLPPGTHPKYSNPYVHMVTPIDVRSQKFEMAGEFSVAFLSKYGFDIKVEGTIEWAPDLKKLPELFVKYVDEQDLKESGGIDNIQRKIMLPFARSFFRTVGGEYRAVDYITGSTRIKVQKEVESRLREACAEEGILIRSFVIRSTDPPEDIREQYARREIAKRDLDRFLKEIETEIGTVLLEGAKPKLDKEGKPVLDEMGRPVTFGGKPKVTKDGKPLREGGRLAKVLQERRKDRETKFGDVRSKIVEEVRAAEQYAKVEITKASKELEVKKIMLEAAKDKAAKILAEGTAKAEVTVMKNKAEAEAVKAKVAAFRSGDKLAEYQLIVKLAPSITRIWSNTEGLFADLFERFSTLKSEAEIRPSSAPAKRASE